MVYSWVLLKDFLRQLFVAVVVDDVEGWDVEDVSAEGFESNTL